MLNVTISSDFDFKEGEESYNPEGIRFSFRSDEKTLGSSNKLHSLVDKSSQDYLAEEDKEIEIKVITDYELEDIEIPYSLNVEIFQADEEYFNALDRALNACTPTGERRCSGDNFKFLEICSSEGFWEKEECEGSCFFSGNNDQYECGTVSYDESDYTEESSGVRVSGAGFSFLIPILIVSLLFYIYLALTLMSIAKKTGTANGWFAWVPILNLILMANIAQMSAWLLFLLIIPVANLIIVGMLWWKIAVRRGFSGGLGLLMFVPIVNLIMLGIFAWKGSGSGDSVAPVRSESKVMGTQPTKTISNVVGSSVRAKSSSGGSFMSSLGAGMSSKKKKLFLILLGALVVMAISILLPWVSISMGFAGMTISGWSIAWTIKLLFFLILGVGALVYFKKEQGAKAAVGLSGLSLLYMIFRLIVPPSIGSGFASVRLSISTIFEFLGFGFYLFVIATIAVGVIAWLFLKESE